MPCYPTPTQSSPRVWTAPHLLEWYRLDPFCFPHIKHIDGVLTEHCQVGSCIPCRVGNGLCVPCSPGQVKPFPGLVPSSVPRGTPCALPHRKLPRPPKALLLKTLLAAPPGL